MKWGLIGKILAVILSLALGCLYVMWRVNSTKPGKPGRLEGMPPKLLPGSKSAFGS